MTVIEVTVVKKHASGFALLRNHSDKRPVRRSHDQAFGFACIHCLASRRTMGKIGGSAERAAPCVA